MPTCEKPQGRLRLPEPSRRVVGFSENLSTFPNGANDLAAVCLTEGGSPVVDLERAE